MSNLSAEKNRFDFGDIKIIFEYPQRSCKDEEIRKEVKSIMASVLQEHLLLQKS